jgi:hypothetical protein
MRKSRVVLPLVFLLAFRAFAQSADVFLYIPTDEDMAAFMGMHRYLAEWEEGTREVSPDAVAALYSGNVGKKDLNSLQFEAFLVSARNPAVRAAVLSYIDSASLSDPLAQTLRKKYAAAVIEGPAFRAASPDGAIDEGIDYFNFTEIGAFEQKLALFAFDADWERVSLDGEADSPDEASDAFYLIAGGATASMTVYCKRHRDVPEESIEGILASEIYPAKFANWQAISPELRGILAESGADRYIVAYGTGPDSSAPDLDCGTFNAYLYDRTSRTLYETSFSLVMSPLNVDYPVRERLQNYFLFHSLFRFLPR